MDASRWVPLGETSTHTMARETAAGTHWSEREMGDGAGVEFREYDSHCAETEAVEAAFARY